MSGLGHGPGQSFRGSCFPCVRDRQGRRRRVRPRRTAPGRTEPRKSPTAKPGRQKTTITNIPHTRTPPLPSRKRTIIQGQELPMENTLGIKGERRLLLPRCEDSCYQGQTLSVSRGHQSWYQVDIVLVSRWDEHSCYRGVVPSKPAPVPLRKGNATCRFCPAKGKGTQSRTFGPSVHGHGGFALLFGRHGHRTVLLGKV